jgi:hypothetical protein
MPAKTNLKRRNTKMESHANPNASSGDTGANTVHDFLAYAAQNETLRAKVSAAKNSQEVAEIAVAAGYNLAHP